MSYAQRVLRRAVERMTVGLPLSSYHFVFGPDDTSDCHGHVLSAWSPEIGRSPGWSATSQTYEMVAREQVPGGKYAGPDEDPPELTPDELRRWGIVFKDIDERIHLDDKLVRCGFTSEGFVAYLERGEELGTTQATPMPTLLEAFEAALWPLE